MATDSAPSAPTQPSATLKGVVERITYQHPTSGYTVLKLKTEYGVEVAVVGQLAGANPGEALHLDGFWASHPQYGRQFKALGFRSILPATSEGMRKYLGSGLIRGVGPVTATRIVDHFGAEALAVIEETPERLREVRGLGPKRVEAIVAAWNEQRAIKDVMLCLQSLGVHTGLAVRIYKTYGDEALSVVQQDPYRLARDVWGIGFKTADTIGAALGIAHDAPERLAAGVRYVLSEAADDHGHLYLPRAELVATAAELLGAAGEQIDAVLPRLVEARDIFIEPRDEVEAVYLSPLGGAEIAVAQRLLRLARAEVDRLSAFQTVAWETAFGWLAGAQGIPPLAEQQAEAVRTALSERVTVLTGGPGTGKSTTIRAIVTLARAKRARVILTAPTGRAAKRMAELTGRESKTIHRLLKLQPGGAAAFDETNPLEADLIVVDEASMLDVFLCNTLLKAIPPGAHLLLVGDVDQLPSVGPGSVLRDVIDSESVAVVRLAVVFRQAEESAIIRNAHRINRGELPRWGREVRDFAVLRVPDEPGAAEEAAARVGELVRERLPRAYGLTPDEIQVLCPMNGGPAGTRRLNELLQEQLNPAAPGRLEVRAGGKLIRQGDRLIALRNNYQLEVFNGDLAYVAGLDPVDQVLKLALDDGRGVDVPFNQADEFGHAFAISVHRAQGSEFRAVVVPVLTAHYLMLQRNLLYTAVTRARELVVLVAQPRAIAIAVHNDRIARRYTALRDRLRELAA
ncbi:MAG TPA: ATP-dependent RecD-like DNA helicase [Thermomicrobiaceae bacterium]|nr:ATP-dependent RecD-like DNA helicase [Thermomicrobiaceae bacterium]